MKTFYDNQIKPLSRELDTTLGVKHIPVKVIEPAGWDFSAFYIPVAVNYTMPSGSKRILNARHIQEMKMIGVLPR